MEYGQKFGGTLRGHSLRGKIPTALKLQPLHLRLMLYPQVATTVAVFVEIHIPAPLDFKYLVYFQTNPQTQVWSLGFGHYTL